MFFEFINPSIKSCSLRIWNGRPANETETFCDWHLHPEYEISLFISGGKTFYIENKAIKLDPGDIIFINSKIPHKATTEVGTVEILLQFIIHNDIRENEKYFHIEKVLDSNFVPYKIIKNGTEENESLANIIKRISKEYSNKEKSYEYYIKSYIYEITAFLYRYNMLICFDDILPKISPLLPALKFVEEHYKEHITLEEITSLLGFSQSHFCRIFKSIMGVSFTEYVNLFRLQKAKDLLGSGDKNVTQISYEVGFTSVAYFIRIFKKHNFCSPNRYKRLKL